MNEFKREERFIVIKRKNLRPIDERELHTWLQQNEIPTCECVVVESDWPEYEQVWEMIKARVTGALTPAEAEREAPEVVGHLLLGGVFDVNEYEDNDIQLDMKIVERLQSELVSDIDAVPLALMAVTQHERIVAAKDAEIERLTDELSDLDFQKRVAIQNEQDAQPARQVGVDINSAVSRFLSWKLPQDFYPDCGISFTRLNHPTSWPVGTNLFTAEQAKAMLEYALNGAALAPAAVAVAIPLELLKKLAHCTDPDCCIAHARGELRALLGKEGE